MTDSKVEPQSYQQGFSSSDYDPTYYDPKEVDKDLHGLGPAEADERTSWGYLGVLCLVFVGLVALALGSNALEDDEPLTEVGSDEIGVPITTPVRLNVEVEGDIVTVEGTVPDEAARVQLMSTVESIYNASNIIDEVMVDPESTLDGGSIAVTGVATVDDERPGALRDAIVADFGLEDGGVTVERSEDESVIPVSIEGFLEDDAIRLSGSVPDQESIDDLTAAAQAAFGSVDGSGLIIDERTWTGAQLRVTGTVAPGDSSHTQFVAEVEGAFGTLLPVDVSAVTVDLSAENLAVIEAELQEAVAVNPILFAPQSSDLDPASDAVLAQIADRLIELPEVQVEIVGHTDDLGPDDENLILSQQRAESVKTRLVELGVEEARLNARGEGEQFPLVPNDSPANREQNRRIEFNLIST